jgi:uncharacterized protein (TIGR02145 family)
MNKLVTTAIILSISLCSSAQDITISFQPKAIETTIDSIWVTNQRTNQKIKLLGSESLILTKTTGIDYLSSFPENEYLYPNPCYGEAFVCFSTSVHQKIELRVFNISGQLLSLIRQNLAPGLHKFQIKFPFIGIYSVAILKDDGFLSYKAVCSGVKLQECKIKYAGSEKSELLKSASVEKTLNYSQGDILLYSAFSEKNNTIMTDSPKASKVYSVEFYECTDPENNNYAVVKIGDQIWMAENLKTTKLKDSTSIPYVTKHTTYPGPITGEYCWYNNEEKNKNIYGALYDCLAGWTGKLCPTGWHVPSDYEWTIDFEGFLENSDYLYESNLYSIAKSLASRTNWDYSSEKGTPGNDPASNNSSGFSALPGCFRHKDGYFSSSLDGYWWSSTAQSANNAWSWRLDLMLGRGSSFTGDKGNGYCIRCVKDN